MSNINRDPNTGCISDRGLAVQAQLAPWVSVLSWIDTAKSCMVSLAHRRKQSRMLPKSKVGK